MRAGCIERIVEESQAFSTRLLSKNSFKPAPRKRSRLRASRFPQSDPGSFCPTLSYGWQVIPAAGR